VRRLIHRTLTGVGYAVLEAADGAEALRCLAAHGGPVDLVLTDVVMPELSGPGLADALAAFARPPRVLFMSGFGASDIAGRGVRPPSGPTLGKPFTAEALIGTVRAALQEAPVVDGVEPAEPAATETHLLATHA
jgi:CheY-like chemotaxis protein